MHELERIERALAEKDLDPDLFERCAQDLLTEKYPGLSPVPGGTDSGRDADLHSARIDTPPRLMVTKSRDYGDIRANMLRGLDSLDKHGVPFDRIVIANPGRLTETYRAKLRMAADEQGARLDAIYDSGFFASRLRRDGEWRKRLLGLSADPITLSTSPRKLAESQWSTLPFVGRAEEFARLSNSNADTILVGKPGVGKTRLLAALDDVAFVDPGASDDRLADDLRWVRPRTVVVDDVGQVPHLAELIQRLRRQEADWLAPRLVLVCWPDEIESVRDLVPGAEEVALDLLERADIDSIVQSMGITAVMPRQEILDQAEGRPGWAVALADLLLQSGWEEILSGEALLGQLDGYLRRSDLSEDARDLLAVASALGGVDDNDLTKLSAHVGVSRSEAGRLLRAVAQGGLLDVERRRTELGHTRSYTVRPPMLSTAIATEHYFLGDVPLGDMRQLFDEWPGRSVELTLTVCAAARLGADAARSAVDGLVDARVGQAIRPSLRQRILTEYLLIDEDAAKRVVQMIQSERTAIGEEEIGSDPAAYPWLVELAFLAAARYGDADALRLLLDLSRHDLRPTNPHPGHPLRKLSDLCGGFSPDQAPTIAHRRLVARLLGEWMPEPANDSDWRVWSSAVESMLTPHISIRYTSPEDVYTVSIVETIVPPTGAMELLNNVWPEVLARASRAPDDVLVNLATVVHAWLIVGSGHDRPFGNRHPDEWIEQAAIVGDHMFHDLTSLAQESLPLLVHLESTASLFDVELPSDLVQAMDADPFFRPVERIEDWESEISSLRADISTKTMPWASEDPVIVVERLATIRDQNASAQLSWPDRVGMACESIAEIVSDPRLWLDACLNQHLFPEAGPFLRATLAAGNAADHDLLRECLNDQRARVTTLLALLTTTASADLLDAAIAAVDASDYELLRSLIARREISDKIQNRLLSETEPDVRSAIAIALFDHRDEARALIHAAGPDDWLSAIQLVNPGTLSAAAKRNFIRLMPYLATTHPSALELIVHRAVREREGSGLFATLGIDVWKALDVLPAAHKESLLAGMSDPYDRQFMLEHLVGGDAEWLDSLLKSETITPEEALSTHGFHGRIPVDRMAQLLVPRGIDPRRIVALSLSGTWSGPRSAHFETLRRQFATYAESEDESVAAIGPVGTEIFQLERDQALESERIGRIRGDL